MRDIDAYTIKEVAKRLQISEDSVQRMIARREMPHVRFGKLIRIPVPAFERWLEEQAQASLTPAEDHLLGR